MDGQNRGAWGGRGAFDQQRGRGRGGRGARGGRGRGAPAFSKQGFGGNSNVGPTAGSEKKFITVPTRNVGRVIGKGGSKIRELEAETGSRVMVSREREGDNTSIQLTGSKDAVASVENLIRDLVIDRPHRNGSSASEKPPSPVEEWKPPTPPQAELSPEFELPKRKLYGDADMAMMMALGEKLTREKWARYPAIIKEFYDELPEISNMSKREVELFREQNNNIVVGRPLEDGVNSTSGTNVPNPIQNFRQAFHNYPDVLSLLDKAGFEKPTPIQSQAWPVLLKGEDLIGIAQTGTGKTLAFLLPALIHIDSQTTPRHERKGPTALVLAPTRELALQIEREVKKYNYKNIRSTCIYGGGDRKAQIKAVQEGVEIIIATPGRLDDLLVAGYIDPEWITYAVLDEADRMLDLGFEPQIRKTMYKVRPTRQTIMTSATWPQGVRRLAQSYMKNPVQVYVGSLDLAAVHSVTQSIWMLPDDDEVKHETFMDLMRSIKPHEKVIVFCGKKIRASSLSCDLVLSGIDCSCLHGDLDQSDREQAIVDISDGIVNILIATDVASRGIDIENLTHVINYDFPRNIEEYVHRVGRTGRAGNTGVSISLFTRQDWRHAAELIKILEEANQEVPDELRRMSRRYDERPRGGGRGGYRGRRNDQIRY